MIWVQNQLVGAVEGQQMTLGCHSEAYPKSINYWTRDKGEIVPQGECLSFLSLFFRDQCWEKNPEPLLLQVIGFSGTRLSVW